MGTTEASKIQQFARRLARRQSELNALLEREPPAAGDREVFDLKDVAAGASQAVVAEAASAQALHELVEVASALRRLRDGSFGVCQECGEPIAEQRLLALPAAAYCASCQSLHEQRLTLAALTRRVPGGGAAHRLGLVGA